MRRISTDSDTTLFSRYECKYIVHPANVPAIREAIAPFMQPDRFAAMHRDLRYPISSLYLDSDDLVLYQQTVGGDTQRFKLRVRTYSDDPEDAAYLEVKRKINAIVRKRRARVSRRIALEVLAGREAGAELPAALREDVDFFTQHAALAGAKPVMRVRYLREAYESRDRDPVRLTLDTDLMHAITLGPDLAHEPGPWVRTPVGGTIVEIKFTERFPSWIHDVVQMFALKQQPVPKYIMSVDEALTGHRAASLSIAGFTMPTLRV